MNPGMHWTKTPAAIVALLSWVSATPAIAEDRAAAIDDDRHIALYYSDGSEADYGIEAINRRLLKIGVRVSQVTIPEKAKPILKQSAHRALSQTESNKLIEHFHLGRQALLEEIHKAGRRPAIYQGGHLQTSEVDVPPYPKVYDMKALDRETTVFLQRKFGKLHVNSSKGGIGIDEVMTIVSGGPYTWFFVFENNLVGKLQFGKVQENDKAWRISYPGLVPHGGYFDAPHGLVVAYAHGPRHFVMRYADRRVKGHATLGDNPWIDFASKEPRLLARSNPTNSTTVLNPPPVPPTFAAEKALETPGSAVDTDAVRRQ